MLRMYPNGHTEIAEGVWSPSGVRTKNPEHVIVKSGQVASY
jgi:hypothetical protein